MLSLTPSDVFDGIKHPLNSESSTSLKSYPTKFTHCTDQFLIKIKKMAESKILVLITGINISRLFPHELCSNMQQEQTKALASKLPRTSFSLHRNITLFSAAVIR